MRHRFPDESRQNLGKIPEDAITENLAPSKQLNEETLPNHPQLKNSARLAQ
jgi:hypothetical protein